MLGYAWSGTECVALADCSCAGADCDKLTQTQQECITNHSSCSKVYPCGSQEVFELKHKACSAMDVHSSGDVCYCAPMGFAWNGTQCVAVKCDCTGSDCNKLSKTQQDCQDAHSSCVKVQPPAYKCGSPELFAQPHESCEPMQAKGSPAEDGGQCNCIMGFSWNGTRCEPVDNGRCVGADCDKLTQTQEACEAKHATCAGQQGS